ncbi:hypothetical protein FJY63_00840 [Candidatus Sumerlaeota bacterium]|nr:hypothetical protein [Candidatus Sumerlaeota bacterium]
MSDKLTSVSVADALRRCEKTSLGNYLPASDQDAAILHAAGLCWTPNHWWHPLNVKGVRALWQINATVPA